MTSKQNCTAMILDWLGFLGLRPKGKKTIPDLVKAAGTTGARVVRFLAKMPPIPTDPPQVY